MKKTHYLRENAQKEKDSITYKVKVYIQNPLLTETFKKENTYT